MIVTKQRKNCRTLKIENYMSEIDWLAELEKGTENLIISGTSNGKALKNGTKVCTPSGYVPIENLKIGDPIFGENGKIYNVTGVFPQGKKQIYKMYFNNSRTVECCEEHLWNWQTYSQRYKNPTKWTTTTTKFLSEQELFKPEKSGVEKRARYYLPNIQAFEYETQELVIPPYSLGAILGVGGLTTTTYSFTNVDEKIVNRLNEELEPLGIELVQQPKKYHYGFRSIEKGKHSEFKKECKRLGLDGKHSYEKSIPKQYKYNSIQNRIDLVAGLLDTDGFISNTQYDIVLSSKQLCLDLKEICESLGCAVTYKERTTGYSTSTGEYKQCKTGYRLFIKPPKEFPILHWSTNKKHNEDITKGYTSARTTLQQIEKTDEYAEMTCISTSNPTELFVIEGGIVTHNTKCFIGNLSQKCNMLIASPFIMLNEQFMEENTKLQVLTGLKPQGENLRDAKNIITTFHSMPRMLECKPNADILVIDEIHYITSYVSFSPKIVNPMFETIDELKRRNPDLIVVYLTATPHFVEEVFIHRGAITYIVECENPKAKPEEVQVVRSIKKTLEQTPNYLYLVPSKKRGVELSKKLHGAYISADVPTTEENYAELIRGVFPTDRVFATVVISTGLSIHDPVDYVMASWTRLDELVQLSARVRSGCKKFIVQIGPQRWLEEYYKDKPQEIDWTTDDYETAFKKLNYKLNYYSMILHTDADALKNALEQMIYRSNEPLEIPDYLIYEYESINMSDEELFTNW